MRATAIISFLCLILLGCNQKEVKNNTSPKNESRDTTENSRITIIFEGVVGKTEEEVSILRNKNSKQAILSAESSDKNSFIINGSLPAPGIYYLKIGQNDPVEFYAEHDKSYSFSAHRWQHDGSFSNFTIESNSAAMKAYNVYNNQKKNSEANLQRRIDELNTLIQTGGTAKYTTYTVELVNREAELREFESQFANQHIQKLAGKDGEALIPYLISLQKISKQNYKPFLKILENLGSDGKKDQYYTTILERVQTVHDKFENSLPFPEMTPRNPEGDSLKFENLTNNKAILVFFYTRWSPQAKAALAVYKGQLNALKQLGVETIYLTWDEEPNKWRSFSNQQRLGKRNYRLNQEDKTFVSENYFVSKFPHLILIDAKTRKILNIRLKEPDDTGFIQDIKNSLD